MRKIFLLLIIFFVLFINILPLAANDKDAKSLFNNSLNQTAKQTGHFESKISKAGALGTIGLVIQIALSIIGVVFLILMIYGGASWMNARGDETKVTKAQGIIRNSIIGIIIVVSAYAITNFVGKNLINQNPMSNSVQKEDE